MFQIFAYQGKEVINMNWRAWISGLIVVFCGASVTAINAIVVQMDPIPPEFKIYIIVLPAFLTALATFLMHSPFPGSVGFPADVVTGIKIPEPPKT